MPVNTHVSSFARTKIFRKPAVTLAPLSSVIVGSSVNEFTPPYDSINSRFLVSTTNASSTMSYINFITAAGTATNIASSSLTLADVIANSNHSSVNFMVTTFSRPFVSTSTSISYATQAAPTTLVSGVLPAGLTGSNLSSVLLMMGNEYAAFHRVTGQYYVLPNGVAPSAAANWTGPFTNLPGIASLGSVFFANDGVNDFICGGNGAQFYYGNSFASVSYVNAADVAAQLGIPGPVEFNGIMADPISHTKILLLYKPSTSTKYILSNTSTSDYSASAWTIQTSASTANPATRWFFNSYTWDAAGNRFIMVGNNQDTSSIQHLGIWIINLSDLTKVINASPPAGISNEAFFGVVADTSGTVFLGGSTSTFTFLGR